MNINLGCLGTHIISIKIQRFPGINVFTLLFIKFFDFRHYFLVKFFLLVSRRSLKKHIPKILLYKQDQDLQKSSSVTGKNILATLSMFLYIYPVRVCVCVCVYTLPPVGFFRLHYVCDIREKFGSTVFCCEYF